MLSHLGWHGACFSLHGESALTDGAFFPSPSTYQAEEARMFSRFGGLVDDLEWPLTGTDTANDGDFAELLRQWTAALLEHCQQRLQVAAEARPDHPMP